MPVAAIFADTQAEPPSVMEWLKYLVSKLPFPVYTVTKGDLLKDSLRLRKSGKSGGTYLRPAIPAWVLGKDGRESLLFRQCTSDYKVVPVQQKALALMREAKGELIAMWLGISKDEAHRMRDSRHDKISNLYPLVDRRITRQGCIDWMRTHGYKDPPRSSCVFCPYHSNQEWRRLLNEEPAQFARAVLYEERLSEAVGKATLLNAKQAFLHRSLKPLRSIDFNTPEPQLSMFGNECEGMCGV